MQKFIYKIGAVLATASLMGLLLAGSALAADLEITSNGVDSTNQINVMDESICTVDQTNNTNVGALVLSSASTGKNTASNNTGGDTSIDTGNATATSTLTVTGGSNTATNPCCCQQGCETCCDSHGVIINGNGVRSENRVTVSKKKDSLVYQNSQTGVGALVGARTRTGRNRARNNTGGNTSIDTGNANSSSTLNVTGGGNSLNP